MVGASKLIVTLACCLVLFCGVAAHAGLLAGNPLAYNDGNGPLAGAWTGSSPFSSGGLVGFVDWAVFTRANFNLLTGGGGGYASPSNELVYAHQIFTSDPVIGAIGMDIPLAGNPAGNAGSFSSLGITGVPAVLAFADSTIASWTLANETDALTPSEGLAYSSRNRPQLSGFPNMIDGGQSAVGVLPLAVPGDVVIPEPASLVMASLAGLLVVLVGRQRTRIARS